MPAFAAVAIRQVDATFNDGLAAQLAMEAVSNESAQDRWQTIERV